MTETIDINSLSVSVIMNTVLDGLITIDSRGIIHSFNPAAERIFQYSQDEVIGNNVNMLMPEPYHAEHDQYLVNYLTTGVKQIIGFGREVSAKRKDGSVFPMELGVNEMDVNGQRIFLGTIRDISARRHAEEALAGEANRLKTVLGTVLDGIITIDRVGVIHRFNAAAERIFGYSADEVIGQNIKNLMPEPYHAQHDQYLKNYFTTQQKKVIGVGRTVAAKRKDGTVFPIDLGVNEMQIDGEPMFVGSIRDISERVASEKAISDYVSKLKRSNQELDDFAYIASHDLKEPLRGLSNNAIFLEEDYESVLDDSGKKRLHRIRYLCKRMETLVDELLYFSRLGRQELAIKPVNLNSVITDIEQMMDLSLEEANAKIVIPQPLPTMTCDVPRITEVFRNLITNALKYNNKEEKWIEVGCLERPLSSETNAAIATFYVKDNGIGIDQVFFNDIFRIFKRLNSESENEKGTGVGLTFVKKIIERHGGQIWLESEIGVGTTFFFTLPDRRQSNE